MPKTRRQLGSNGVTFTGALSPAPLCCPARAEIVTGQYGQNNGVRHNKGKFGGFHALKGKRNTIAAWVQRAGYQTGFVGKYLNGFGARDPRQEGWTRWNPAVRNIYDYKGTRFDNDGDRRTHGGNVTRVIARYADRYVREFAAADSPFFLWVSHLPPHDRHRGRDAAGRPDWVPPLPTRQHRRELEDVLATSRTKPSFNASSGVHQPYPGRTRRPIATTWVQNKFTRRIQSLQDVDDAVATLVAALRETGELQDTYIFFTSDNGTLLGEHRLEGKNVLFREALQIPLIVRLPGTADPRTSRKPVTLTDLAPTIAALAGAIPGRVMDGQPFSEILAGERVRWRDTQLIQTGSLRRHGPAPGWEFRGVRTRRYTYMRRVTDGEGYLYDRRADPYERVDVALRPRYRAVRRELEARHDALVACTAALCNRDFGRLPRPRR
jgi:arylsulfatase A-like enzyme